MISGVFSISIRGRDAVGAERVGCGGEARPLPVKIIFVPKMISLGAF